MPIVTTMYSKTLNCLLVIAVSTSAYGYTTTLGVNAQSNAKSGDNVWNPSTPAPASDISKAGSAAPITDGGALEGSGNGAGSSKADAEYDAIVSAYKHGNYAEAE